MRPRGSGTVAAGGLMKNGYLLPTGGSAPSVIAAPIRVALSRALLAGFLASLAMLVAFSVAFVVALILGNTPVPIVNEWSRGLTSNALIDVARPSLYGAAAIFFAGGLLWALLYGLVFEPRLKGPG